MEKTRFLRNGITAILIPMLCFFLLGGLVACKDGEKEDADETTTASITSKEDSAAAAAPVGRFYNLRLSKEKLIELFKDGNTRKVLLQFVDSNLANGSVGLVAYGATANGVKTTDAIGLERTDDHGVTIDGIKILGNQELSKKGVVAALGLNGNPPINAGNAKDIFFTPMKSTLYPNYIVYSYRSEMQIAEPTDPTNPSPPAPPCTTDCEGLN